MGSTEEDATNDSTDCKTKTEETDLETKLGKLDLNAESRDEPEEEEKVRSISLTEKPVEKDSTTDDKGKDDSEEIYDDTKEKDEDGQTEGQTEGQIEEGQTDPVKTKVKNRAPVHGVATSYAANTFNGIDPNFVPQLRADLPVDEPTWSPPPQCSISLIEKEPPPILLKPTGNQPRKRC